MKFIDEKGNLLGKINIIDFLVIMFFVCIIPVLFLVHSVITKRQEPPRVSIETEINCKFLKVNPGVLSMIKVGDKELDKDGTTLAEIVWLGDIKPHEYEFRIGGAEKIIKEDEELKDVFAKLRINAEVREKNLYYRDNPISLDAPIRFSTGQYTLQVVPAILDIYKKQEIYIETDCKLIKVKPEVINLIKVGDKELDKDGTTLAEIVWLGDIKPHEYEFNVGGVGKIMKVDKELKDIFVKVKLKAEAEQENSILFYKGRQFLLNFPIEFNMRDYSLQAVPILVSRKESLKERWVEVRLRLTGISPDLANIMHEKDVELDSEKRTVGILQKIITNKPSQVLTIKESDFVALNHPYLRDIDIVVDILGTEKEGVLYFKNYPIKIGNTLMFTTEFYNVNGAIVGLEIK